MASTLSRDRAYSDRLGLETKYIAIKSADPTISKDCVDVLDQYSSSVSPTNFSRDVLQNSWRDIGSSTKAENESFDDSLIINIAIGHRPKSTYARPGGIHVRRKTFLDRANRLDNLGKTDGALDIIFDQFDEMLLASDFAKVNQFLASIAPINFSVDLLLGILTVTLPAKNRLSSRSLFFKRVKQTLSERGETEDGLLVGLD